MGLAAGQARLLSITSRKSDCEFQSMRLSHQKIALSRELADLSNEYQNSLDQTKLVYDYYGTGDTNTPLTYGILMNPSTLNDYMPITLTDTSGRVTLNSKYAAAAKAAGIPQEGLGTLPSETMRNAFVNGLAQAGLITDKTASTILGLPYNQGAGFGGDTTVALITDNGNINELLEYIHNTSTSTYSFTSLGYEPVVNKTNAGSTTPPTTSFSVYDLLSGTKSYSLLMISDDGQHYPDTKVQDVANKLVSPNGFVDWLYDEFSAVLDLGDGLTGAALSYAKSELTNLISWTGNLDEVSSKLGEYKYTNSSRDANNQSNSNYMSFTHTKLKSGIMHEKRNSYAAINFNNLAKAFITYFADYMNGVDKTDANGIDKYYVNKGSLKNSNRLATDDSLYMYTWATGSTVSSDDTGQAVFFDTLFNQICASGWTEDNNIGDKDYLQQMLQSGKLYISKIKDDGYYYQANYATDSYIKEIADETYIAQAEAKYNTQKEKLNSKEETLDLKMKNLDTEISSLTTEYDTVKNTISKNIEKSFKRYNA